MIGGWLLKIVIGVALVGFAVVELGSPLIGRAQADDAAHEVADETALLVGTSPTQAVLDEGCETQAAEADVEIASCVVSAHADGQYIDVTVIKHARSFLLKRFSFAKSWYEVEVSASAKIR